MSDTKIPALLPKGATLLQAYPEVRERLKDYLLTDKSNGVIQRVLTGHGRRVVGLYLSDQGYRIQFLFETPEHCDPKVGAISSEELTELHNEIFDENTKIELTMFQVKKIMEALNRAEEYITSEEESGDGHCSRNPADCAEIKLLYDAGFILNSKQ